MAPAGVLQPQAGRRGRGRFVRRRGGHGANNGAGRAALGAEGVGGVRLLSVGVVAAPMRAASVLGLDEGSAVLARRRLVTTTAGPVRLATVYIPVELAQGTDATASRPLAEDIITHVARRKRVSFDYATDRISARMPTAEEARLLDITRRDPVLAVLVCAFDTQGVARIAADAVLPSARAELEDSFLLG